MSVGRIFGRVLNKYRNDWICTYCEQELMIKDSEYPYFQSFSIDHKKSIDLGGTNDIDNLTICCHRCNIVKSTMKAETFKKLLETSEPLLEKENLLDEAFYEMYRGKLSNKLDREDKR